MWRCLTTNWERAERKVCAEYTSSEAVGCHAHHRDIGVAKADGAEGGIAQEARDSDIGAGKPMVVDAPDQAGAGPYILEAAASIEARKD